jgi:5-methylcytosine-specific restriction protein A
MPKMPPRPCTAPRCKSFAVKGGRCEEHEVKHGWEHTKSRHERGYGGPWEKMRESVLKRDCFLCQTCKRCRRYRQGTEVDHITPKHLGGMDTMENLEAICNTCHKDKTQKESQNAKRT